MPSLSEKPSAKSSRSAGVASMTACEMPLYTSATGTSSATASSAGVHAPSHTRSTRRTEAADAASAPSPALKSDMLFMTAVPEWSGFDPDSPNRIFCAAPHGNNNGRKVLPACVWRRTEGRTACAHAGLIAPGGGAPSWWIVMDKEGKGHEPEHPGRRLGLIEGSRQHPARGTGAATARRAPAQAEQAGRLRLRQLRLGQARAPASGGVLRKRGQGHRLGNHQQAHRRRFLRCATPCANSKAGTTTTSKTPAG
jgi:hypothetical protein